jgi:hypothetical protein
MRSSGSDTASGPLRRAQLSFGAVWASETAFVVGLAVLAFQSGGVTAVGVVTAARMAAAALLAPPIATVADRVRRERVLAAIGLGRAAALGAAALVAAVDGPTVAIYGLAIVATVAQALYRPAHSALLPTLCTSPQQLTRANAVRGTLDSAATLGGPVVAAVLLAVSGPAAVFAACAVASLIGGLVVVRLSYDAPPRRHGAGGGAREILRGSTCSAPGTRAWASSTPRSAPAGSSARSSRSGWSGVAGSLPGSVSGSRCSGRR